MRLLPILLTLSVAFLNLGLVTPVIAEEAKPVAPVLFSEGESKGEATIFKKPLAKCTEIPDAKVAILSEWVKRKPWERLGKQAIPALRNYGYFAFVVEGQKTCDVLSVFADGENIYAVTGEVQPDGSIKIPVDGYSMEAKGIADLLLPSLKKHMPDGWHAIRQFQIEFGTPK